MNWFYKIRQKDELRILRGLNGNYFQKLIDFINTSECVILVIEKVTPHPNDNFIDKCARTSTLRDAINFEASKQAKLQVQGIRIENNRC